MFNKYIPLILLAALAAPSFAEDRDHGKSDDRTILRFETMYAVDGAFLTPEGATDPNIRGIVGDYQAWKIKKFIKGELSADGMLNVEVRGLVFPNAPNDEDNFRAAVSCLTDDNGDMAVQNAITAPFPTGPEGNAKIKAHLQLPSPCVAPVVLIMNGDPAEGDAWFAVSGF